MGSFFTGAPVAVRDDIERSHQSVWDNFGRPGAYLTGAERVAVIAEMRAAVTCGLCKARKEALSPNMVQGEHDRTGEVLSPPAIEAVHRVITDPGRLTESWVKKLISQGLSEGAYIEIVGIIVQAIVIETFDRALGLGPRALPALHDGAPSGFVPEGLVYEGAWVKTVPTALGLKTLGPEIYFQASMADQEYVPFVNRALSHAPEEIRGYGRLTASDYIPFADVGNFPEYAKYGRAISPLQIELTSSRISALNGCFY